MKIFNSIVTICAAFLVLFVLLNGLVANKGLASIELLQLLPSFDIIIWVAAALLLVMIILIGVKKISFLIAFFLLSVQLIYRHSDHSFDYTSESSPTDTLKVLSLNVGQFSNDTAVVNQCIKLIREEKPDIVCMQEFGLYYKWPDVNSVIADFAFKTGYNYFDFSPTKGNIFGTAFLSYYEIERVDTLFQLLSHTNEAKVYSVLVGQRVIKIVNVHLQSYNLFSARDSLSISSIRSSIALRNEQAQLIVEARPDIVVGDFNASPGTFVHQMLCDEYMDVQRVKGNPLRFTHQAFPTRLDYIFILPNHRIRSFHLNDQSPSDHKAIVAKILL